MILNIHFCVNLSLYLRLKCPCFGAHFKGLAHCFVVSWIWEALWLSLRLGDRALCMTHRQSAAGYALSDRRHEADCSLLSGKGAQAAFSPRSPELSESDVSQVSPCTCTEEEHAGPELILSSGEKRRWREPSKNGRGKEGGRGETESFLLWNLNKPSLGREERSLASLPHSSGV